MNFKKIDLKRVGYIGGWFILLAGIAALMGFVSVDSKKIICTEIRINIIDESEKGFIDRSDINQLLAMQAGKITGTRIADINIPVLEKVINANPYISRAEVFSSINGALNINIEQRTPQMRIINTKDESFYIDTDGRFMPLSEKYTDPVLVASGYIFDTYAGRQVYDSAFYSVNDSVKPLRMIDRLFYLARYVSSDTLWNAMIQQIYITPAQEIELIPRIGNHIIVLGDINNLNEKFNNLYKFYTEGLNQTGWDNYAIINLKFKNQVVCTYNKNLNTTVREKKQISN